MAPPGNQAANGEHKLHAWSTGRSHSTRLKQNVRVLAKLHYIIAFILSSLIGFLAVKVPDTLHGVSMAGFWAGVLCIIFYRIRKREVGESWFLQIILIGLFIRFVMAFAHLAIGLWFYGGKYYEY